MSAAAAASAIPAAGQSGPRSSSRGVDLAERLLALWHAKRSAELVRISSCGDMVSGFPGRAPSTRWSAVFMIFFVPDMERQGSRTGAWSPGGRLALTTWEAACSRQDPPAWWAAVRQVRSTIPAVSPWERICDPRGAAAAVDRERHRRSEIVAEDQYDRPCDPMIGGLSCSALRLSLDGRPDERGSHRACAPPISNRSADA